MEARREVYWMASFATIQASLFFDLRRQVSSNKLSLSSKKWPPLERLDRLTYLAQWHHLMLVGLPLVSCVRYIPIILIKMDAFKSLRWLDCFLVGRFTFVGRTSEASPYLAMGLFGMLVYYRTLMARPKQGHPYRFFALEFLLYDYDYIQVQETQAKPRRTPGKLIETTGTYGKHLPIDRVLYLENLFWSGPHDDQLILRPNRSSASWLAMARYTRTFFYSVLVSSFAVLGSIHFMMAGNLLTRMGFELNYRKCCEWLKEQQQQQPDYLNLIHKTNKNLAHEIHIDELPFFTPLENYVEMSLYSMARILFDFVENNLWYTNFWLTFVSFAYNSHLSCFDLIINANEIKRRLRLVIHRMQRLVGPSGGGEATFACRDGRQLDRDVRHLQAVILDHLVMVRGYSPYVSMYLFWCLYLWFQESAVICVWMGVTRSRAVELEFAWIEVVTFLTFVALLSGTAVLKHNSSHLHRLVSSAAALDQVTDSKRRWTIIIQSFYPRSACCFALFNSIELSWLFCLKLLSWIVSAVLVLANFFYMQQGPSLDLMEAN